MLISSPQFEVDFESLNTTHLKSPSEPPNTIPSRIESAIESLHSPLDAKLVDSNSVLQVEQNKLAAPPAAPTFELDKPRDKHTRNSFD